MIDIDFESLRGIGLTQSIVSQLGTLPDNSTRQTRLMRVVETQRDWFALHDGRQDFRGRALPRLVQLLQAQDSNVTVGDWVLVEDDEHRDLWIAERLPPVTQIARRANDGRRQPLASNVDTALLTMGLDADFNARRMERYIAMVRACGVVPVVVLTKKDVGIDVAFRIGDLRRRLPDSVAIAAVNGTSEEARTALAAWLDAGQTLVLLGSSGAGKSTLTNTLTASAAQDTGGTRKGDGRGRHTTTSRSLHQCPEGACIIDTPGLRTWRPDADGHALAATYDDIAALSAQCQFRDCRHAGEPGCAVRANVPEDRLLNFQKLIRDAERSEQTPLDRINLRRKWKALGKAGSQRLREKRQ